MWSCCKESRGDFSPARAQNWELQDHQCARTSVLLQSPKTHSDPNHHVQDGEWLGTDRVGLEGITICQQSNSCKYPSATTAGSDFFPPQSRADTVSRPPLPSPAHPPCAPLTQVGVVAGEELPELLQARFLPHGHGGSPGGVLVRDSSHQGNDRPQGEGLLLLQGAPHTALL